MSVDENQFLHLAEQTLSMIADRVDDELGDDVDVEFSGGILTLILESGGQYVINKHAPNRQIWMSSPLSGATHFDLVDENWVGSRDKGANLLVMLAAELSQKLDTEFSF